MLFTKHTLFSVVLILVSGLAVSISAQQNSAVTQPVADTKPSAKQEAAAGQSASPSPENKDANERLPFMAESGRENQQTEAPSATGLLLRTFGALLLIVGLIIAAAWGMKRFGGARFGAPKEDAPELAVLNSISLGERRSLAIVRFGQRTLLIGSTAQAVTLLAETDSENNSPEMHSVADILNASVPGPFAEELSLAANRMESPGGIGGKDIEW